MLKKLQGCVVFFDGSTTLGGMDYASDKNILVNELPRDGAVHKKYCPH
jgi:hypothetical protein